MVHLVFLQFPSTRLLIILFLSLFGDGSPQAELRPNSGQTFKIITLEEPEVMLKLKPSYYSSSTSFTEVSCLQQKYNREPLEPER